MFRNIIWGISLLVIIVSIGFLFWKQELQYLLPTPIPQNYKNIPLGEEVDFAFQNQLNPSKSTLVHFYNPTCPCSKFNLTHYEELYEKYHEQLNFVFVFHTKEERINKEEQLSIEKQVEAISDLTLYDGQKVIAKQCGVYSTPQAVVLRSNKKLFYRGNYNKNRYCTAPNTKFTQQAIEALINKKHCLTFQKKQQQLMVVN